LRWSASTTLAGHCRLTGIFNDALAAFLEQLYRYTLANLLSAPMPARPARRKP
jgi:Rrf2 family nitric oxide-sensitive transcriptional repressor